MEFIIFFYVIIIRFFGEISVEASRVGLIKKWLPDLEWSTRTNWQDNLVPESQARVSFPLEIFHSVGLPSSDLLISGIELPRDGALLLAINGNLQLTELEKRTKTRTWKPDGPLYWADPNNWNSSSATPHFERIPCGTDTVILPEKNRSLSVRLPNADVQVMEIKMGERERIDEWRWQSYMRGREFRRSRTSVHLSGLQFCISDCLCKPDDPHELLSEICRIQGPKCEASKCEYPLQVEGHCCYYCGGRVKVNLSEHSIPKLNEITEQALKNFHESISWHARASWHDKNVEILITETGLYSGIKSQEAIEKLAGVLIAKGIPVIYTETSGAPMSGSALGNILGPMFGIPLVFILAVVVALPYFGYSYNYVISIGREALNSIRDKGNSDGNTNTSGSFGFARFENLAEGDVHLSRVITAENEMMEVDNEDGDNVMQQSSGKRFENPLYRSRRKSVITTTTTTTSDNSENIVNIEGIVSLTELQKKVCAADEDNSTEDSD